jgi:tRNA A37 N6-isopentenylltransferase MiaA
MLKDIIQFFNTGHFNSIVIYGATASGKSELALRFANELKAALIINADPCLNLKSI